MKCLWDAAVLMWNRIHPLVTTEKQRLYCLFALMLTTQQHLNKINTSKLLILVSPTIWAPQQLLLQSQDDTTSKVGRVWTGSRNGHQRFVEAPAVKYDDVTKWNVISSKSAILSWKYTWRGWGGGGEEGVGVDPPHRKTLVQMLTLEAAETPWTFFWSGYFSAD